MVRGREVGWAGVMVRGVAAAVLVVAACSVDNPENTTPTQPEEAVEPVESIQLMGGEPTFTPFTVAPTILNRSEVVAAMAQQYPPLLRDAGIGGTVRVYFFINAEGQVEQTVLDHTSGHQALDEAAMAVAGTYRFSPAFNRDKRVPVWVSFPLTFNVR